MATLQRPVSADVNERARAVMARQVDQLRRITDDLLDTVQMQRGTFVLDAAPLDAVGAVSDCVDTGASAKNAGMPTSPSMPIVAPSIVMPFDHRGDRNHAALGK
jgi:hypothetical protein